MKHFVMTIKGQSLSFSAGDIKAMQEVLSVATRQQDGKAQRFGQSGHITIEPDRRASTDHHTRQPDSPNVHRLNDTRQVVLTDC